MSRPNRNAGHISLITTGGTIACAQDPASGDLLPVISGEILAQAVEYPLTVRELSLIDSSAMTLSQVDAVISAVHDELADADCRGVVITHGTDTMEETALALRLFHRDSRRVVLTGAQRAWDHPSSDGPSNLRAACAAVCEATDGWVGIAFGGELVGALGAHKLHTEDLVAFGGGYAPGILPDLPTLSLADAPSVEIVYSWPDAPGEIIEDAWRRGARGLVVAAHGTGNIGPRYAEAIGRALDRGCTVVISTRCAHGAVSAAYGGSGGGADLRRRGAVFAGRLKPPQARMLLLACLSGGLDSAHVFASLG